MSASSKIDKKIADLGDWRGERLAEIRKLIHEAAPEVVEEWKWMGSPCVVSQRGCRRRQGDPKEQGAADVRARRRASLIRARDCSTQALDSDTMLDDRTPRQGDAIDASRACKALVREAVAYNGRQDG